MAFEQLSDTEHLLEGFSLVLVWIFIVLFTLTPLYCSIPTSLPVFPFIILFTLKYGFCSTCLFQDVSCSPAISSVSLPVVDVLQSFIHDLCTPSLGILLSQPAAQPALWNWRMGPTVSKELKVSSWNAGTSPLSWSQTLQ